MSTRENGLNLSEVSFEALNKIAQHDAEIKILGDKILSFDGHLRDVNRKLETIASSLSTFVARPQFDLANMISLGKDIAVVIGACVAAIVYVAGSYSDTKLTVISERQQAYREDSVKVEKAFAAEIADIRKRLWTRDEHTQWCKANKANYDKVVCD